MEWRRFVTYLRNDPRIIIIIIINKSFHYCSFYTISNSVACAKFLTTFNFVFAEYFIGWSPSYRSTNSIKVLI